MNGKMQIALLLACAVWLAACGGKKEEQAATPNSDADLAYKTLEGPAEDAPAYLESITLRCPAAERMNQRLLCAARLPRMAEAWEAAGLAPGDGLIAQLDLLDDAGAPVRLRGDSSKTAVATIELMRHAPPRAELDLPLRLLDLPEGRKPLRVRLTLRGGKADGPDKPLRPVSGPPLESRLLAFEAPLPLARAYRLHLVGGEIDKKAYKPDKADLHIPGLGKGYPDWFCQIESGGKVEAVSPTNKNSLELKAPYASPEIWLTEGDSLRLVFYERDGLLRNELLGWRILPVRGTSRDPAAPDTFNLRKMKGIAVALEPVPVE